MKIDKNKVSDVRKHWGSRMPMMTMEECGELIQALTKHERKQTDETLDHVVEEIRDMYICLEALKGYFDIEDKKLEQLIDQKLSTKKTV